jgi:hypothetical protein
MQQRASVAKKHTVFTLWSLMDTVCSPWLATGSVGSSATGLTQASEATYGTGRKLG